MYETLVKITLIIFFVIPLVITVLVFVIAATFMQIQDDIKKAEVKQHEPRRRRQLQGRAQTASRA